MILFQSTLPMQGVTNGGQQTLALGVFQSTLPMQGVTWEKGVDVYVDGVSIHTPYAGSDWWTFSPTTNQ